MLGWLNPRGARLTPGSSRVNHIPERLYGCRYKRRGWRSSQLCRAAARARASAVSLHLLSAGAAPAREEPHGQV